MSAIPILCMVFYIWFEKSFGQFDIGSILFHIEMGVENTAEDNIYRISVKYLFIASIILLSLGYLVRYDDRIKLCDRLLALPIFCMTPFFTYFAGSIFYKEDNAALMQYYIQPAYGENSPQLNNKNIILIYAESTEWTFAELEGSSDFFQGMINIASQGMHIKGIGQVANTGWTVAGLISSQCGVPLQPLGLMKGNRFEARKAFLPGTVCLSDIANRNGYNTEFLNGSSLGFAGMKRFLTQHGYHHTGAYEQMIAKVGSYNNSWGLYDDTLLEYATQRIEYLQGQDKPFLLTLMTIGGHFPEGYPTQTCLDDLGEIKTEKILYAAKCTGYHIESFIKKLKETGLLNNTIVVVMSDHLAMKNSATPRLEQHERINFFTILADDITPQIVTKQAAMFDVFPTVLQLMGYALPQESMGLGVSLFSEKPGLIKVLGVEKLNQYIKYDRALSKRIWSSPDAV